MDQTKQYVQTSEQLAALERRLQAADRQGHKRKTDSWLVQQLLSAARGVLTADSIGLSRSPVQDCIQAVCGTRNLPAKAMEEAVADYCFSIFPPVHQLLNKAEVVLMKIEADIRSQSQQ